MESIWRVYGEYMENVWSVYGEYMESIWRVSGSEIVVEVLAIA